MKANLRTAIVDYSACRCYIRFEGRERWREWDTCRVIGEAGLVLSYGKSFLLDYVC